MNELTHLDLFTGIGGFKLAAEWGGYRTVAFSEVEPFACKLLSERWPDIPNAGDVRVTSNFARFRGVTILTGGFPCQPFSHAGKRKGKDDDRHLWPAMRDVIETVGPAWVIGENVPGLIDMELDAAIADLESLGYAVQPIVIPACAVDAHHLRERIWIIAHHDGIGGRNKSKSFAGGGDKTDPTHNGSTQSLAYGECEQDDTQREDNQRRRVRLGRDPETALGTHGATNSNSIGGCGGVLADPSGDGTRIVSARPGNERQGEAHADRDGVTMADPQRRRLQGGNEQRPRAAAVIASAIGRNSRRGEQRQTWRSEPAICRVAYGIPDQSHRLKGLGNAIVPQVVAPFFEWIAQIERGEIT